ncbi:FAD-dependent oxidoreductase [Amycolatopsis rubida]|uniref:FAD-dependent oxidoreductase n=1 Tax=Amycolatopsis rubida TaxID=112413 RepID=A0ABX0C261_9PSEU|nr:MULTISPECIES: FAD-dependent monooxygenase [Amycolatopsis]MYW94019.1 FAD-dependent oxidoreductase [Amycolatopsis rubida]NEC59008.1 FAD-dependent oxidoreductase [Amycolatopsis rubida]OAP22107.1 Pentachlorophenol 4-monooxygenase [Amycolatopsis sp. M39]
MHDVVIAGAGPVGLFLAGELALAGCSVLVLEKEADPHSPWRKMPLGMRGLSGGSAEAFYRRGMLRPLLAESGLAPAEEEQVRPSWVGHFAGTPLDPADVDLSALPYRLPSPALDGIMTSLEAVETVLAERAVKHGAEIRHGVQVSGLVQDDEGVLVRDGDHEYPARWLVGCDGGRSTVRRLAGFAFVGTEPQLTGYVALATFADPGELTPGFNLTPAGMYLTMPTPGHFGVLDFDGGTYDRSQPLTREHLQTVLRRVSGTDVTLDEVHLASSFTDRALQTTGYRRGRVLLAGDAAHIHSPLGGQGLNLGIGDAMNLGWKLAATVRGAAPDGLLDTYVAERHPIGARVLDWSRAQVAVMRPDPHSRAIQAVTRDLMTTRAGTTYVFERASGLSLRYDLGDDHPLVGHNAPDFRLADGNRLGELLQDGQGVALDFSDDGRLRDVAERYPVQYKAVPAHDDLGYDAVLVRPDGIVAWASDRDPDPGSFENALTRWF